MEYRGKEYAVYSTLAHLHRHRATVDKIGVREAGRVAEAELLGVEAQVKAPGEGAVGEGAVGGGAGGGGAGEPRGDVERAHAQRVAMQREDQRHDRVSICPGPVRRPTFPRNGDEGRYTFQKGLGVG